jgi:hypothetical protein
MLIRAIAGSDEAHCRIVELQEDILHVPISFFEV